MDIKKLLPYTCIMLLAVSFTACSDSSSTGTDHGQPPAIPNLATNAQPDISFFQTNNPQSAALLEVNNFNTAKAAVTAGAAFTAIGQIYLGYINPASNNQANFKDGQWVWEYSASQGGASYSIRTTAKEEGTGYRWTTYISYDDGKGNSVDNVKIMEGMTSDDGAKGKWTFFVPDGSNQSAIKSDWTAVSATQKTINVTLYDEGQAGLTINYQQDGPSNTMTFQYQDGNTADTEVFWNTDTHVGYIDNGDQRECWNGSFQDVSCSDAGF